MARRLPSPITQHFDKTTGAPLAGGQMFFYESGSTTVLKDTFVTSDENGAVNTNPVILDGNGFEPPIFGVGAYNVILRASPIAPATTGVIQWTRDPVDFGSEGGQFGDWVSSARYDVNSIVEGSDGNFYISISDSDVDPNINKNPTVASNSPYWSQFDLINRWNADENYVIDDVVRGSDGILYTSKTDNVGNDPTLDTNAVNWKMFDNIRIDGSDIFTTDSSDLLLEGKKSISYASPYVSSIAYENGSYVTGSNGLIYKSIQAVPASNDPTTSPTFWSVVEVVYRWNTNQSYVTDDKVYGTDGIRYTAVQASTGEDPTTDTSGTYWKMFGNVRIGGNTVTVTDTDGDINIEPSGAGDINLTVDDGDVNLIADEGDVNLTSTSGTVNKNGLEIASLQITRQVFSADGTWTKPAGCRSVFIQVVGAGGGGGGTNDLASGGQGGGAGEYREGYFDVTDPLLVSATVTIGSGGAGSTASGGNGSTSSFISNDSAISITCAGGTGGSGAVTAGSNTILSRNGGSGGSGGDLNINGGDGSNGFGRSSALAIGGTGGASYFGGGGAGRIVTSPLSGTGGQARCAGTGGGGAAQTVDGTVPRAGGAGRDGLCIVTEYY